jgi:RNA polymerase sigma-70 factor (ECF subfamily)
MSVLRAIADQTRTWSLAPESVEEEQAIIRRARRGDEDAFARLVERHQTGVFTLLRRMTGDPEEAVDLAQETFLRAWRGLPAFRGDARFGTWLYRIAYNVCLSRRLVYPGALARLDLAGELAGAEAEEPARAFEVGERRARLLALVDRLPPAYRLVLHLYYWGELSYPEIAAILRLPLGTVKTHLHRARAALRAELTAEANPDGL